MSEFQASPPLPFFNNGPQDSSQQNKNYQNQAGGSSSVNQSFVMKNVESEKTLQLTNEMETLKKTLS